MLYMETEGQYQFCTEKAAIESGVKQRSTEERRRNNNICCAYIVYMSHYVVFVLYMIMLGEEKVYYDHLPLFPLYVSHQVILH